MSELATIAPPSEDEFQHEPPPGEATGAEDADLAWQERAYFTMHDPSGIGLDFGFGRHPMVGEIGAYSAYACLNTVDRQLNVRAKGPLTSRTGAPQPLPMTVEMLEQGRVWRASLEHELLGFDLTFEGRSGLGLLPQAEIAGKKGRAASTRVIFQSGIYTGEIRAAGETIAVDGWRGARDRTWGYRKHEGRLPSGLLCAIILEFEGHELILWKVERRTGEIAMSAGMRLDADGGITTVDDWAVELDVNAAVGSVNGAELRVGSEQFHLEPTGSAIYLAGGGYLASGRHGSAADATEVEAESWNLSEDAGKAAVTGLDDHVVNVSGAATGSGILELQIGRHALYLPDGWESNEEGLDIAALHA